MDGMKLPDAPNLLLACERGVLRVTLNRPESRNAMSRALVAELDAVFDFAAYTPEVRVIVLRGAGGNFCAGGDLREMRSDGVKPSAPGAADPIVVLSRSFGSLLRKAGRLPQVVIAICEGATLAGGFGLACVSDIAFAKHDAKFGVPETTRGLPPAQIAPFIVERIGLTATRRLCLTGAMFDGAEALRLGIVHEGFADEAELQAKLAALLDQVLSCAPSANAMTKAILLNDARLDRDALLDDAARKFAAAVRGPEASEGIAAFMQKRRPKWAQPG